MSEGPVSVTLNWTGAVTHSAALQVKGYDVSGSVLSEGSPVTDVQVRQYKARAYGLIMVPESSLNLL